MCRMISVMEYVKTVYCTVAIPAECRGGTILSFFLIIPSVRRQPAHFTAVNTMSHTDAPFSSFWPLPKVNFV